ncbi:hypothetical protein D3C76_1098620 [compost metagenome]
MQEADADGGFTARGVTRRGNTGFGVLGDVAVELLQVVEGLIFPPQLDEGRQRGVGGAGALRIGNLDLAFVFRFGQIFPALRHRQIFLFQALGVDAKTENADVHGGGEIAFHLRRIAEFLHDLLKVFRFVRLQQPHFTGLRLRIERAAVPDIRLRVFLLGIDFRQRAAGAVADE